MEHDFTFCIFDLLFCSTFLCGVPFRLAHRYRTAASLEDLPVSSCEELVGVLLDLLERLNKGVDCLGRHRSIADFMNEANKMQVCQYFLPCRATI